MINTIPSEELDNYIGAAVMLTIRSRQDSIEGKLLAVQPHYIKLLKSFNNEMDLKKPLEVFTFVEMGVIETFNIIKLPNGKETNT